MRKTKEGPGLPELQSVWERLQFMDDFTRAYLDYQKLQLVPEIQQENLLRFIESFKEFKKRISELDLITVLEIASVDTQSYKNLISFIKLYTELKKVCFSIFEIDFDNKDELGTKQIRSALEKMKDLLSRLQELLKELEEQINGSKPKKT